MRHAADLLAVAFRREDHPSFAAGSNGVFTATYRADADYQYYAFERPGQTSSAKITRAR